MSTDMTGFVTPYDPMAAFKTAQNSNYTFGVDTPVPTTYPTGDGTTAGSSIFDNFLGSKTADGAQTQGWGAPAIGAASGLFNAWLGMQQYGLAKQQLATSKNQFALNYDAQRTTTNADLADRQAARVASNPNAYQSVSSYMAQNGIKSLTGA